MFDTLLTMEASGGSSGGGGSEELIAYEVAQITEKLCEELTGVEHQMHAVRRSRRPVV